MFKDVDWWTFRLYKTVIEQAKKMELAELDDGGSSSSNHSSIEHKDLLNNTKLLLENGYLNLSYIY